MGHENTPYAAPTRDRRATRRAPDRLAGWLKWYFRANSGAIWARLDFNRVGGRLGLSTRTIYRAKAYLMTHGAYYGLKFVTVNHQGRWQTLVALEDRLKYDALPLHFERSGRCRLLREWIFGRIYPTPEHVETDKRVTIRSNDSRKVYKRGAPRGGEKSKRGKKEPEGDKGRYYHALARHLGRLHWDNCKVRRLHGAIVGFVRRSIRAGIAPRHIIGAYYSALVTCHGMATDEGLSSGRFDLTYSGASTLAKAYALLGFEPIDTDKGIQYFKVHFVRL